MIPEKLKYGDEIRVIAPSRSVSVIYKEVYYEALKFLSKNYKVTFSKNCRELDVESSSSVASRVSDIHEAFEDKGVKAILTCIGGFNSNQIIDHIDYSIIKKNPKIICGYSDVTALLSAIYTKTGLVTYYGTQFSTFGFLENREYTNEVFEKCLLQNEEFDILPSKEAGGYIAIQDGECEGEIIGGNLCTLNLLQGTEYMPELNDKIIFVEDVNLIGDSFTKEFDRDLHSLLQDKTIQNIKGLVIGRFDPDCNMDEESVRRILSTKPHLNNIPIAFNVDFGHVRPLSTFPLGGRARITISDNKVSVRIIEH